MAEMVLDCPFCPADSVGFISAGNGLLGQNGYDKQWTTLFQCRVCKNGVVVILAGDGNSHHTDKGPHAGHGDPQTFGYKVSYMYPQKSAEDIPKHIPKKIESNYREALSSITHGNYTAAVMMFRKVLDRATLEIDSSLSGERLSDRIKSLSQNHKITPAMKQWADIIKVEGNVATHDRDADEVTAKQLYSFTEMFLRYVFTLDTEVKNHLATQKNSTKPKPAKPKTAAT